METNNKKCKFCSEEIKSDAIKCKHCNEWVDSGNKKINTKNYSSKTSTTKFIILYLATFGLYPLFWMYDQWTLLKERQQLNISPFWRSFFATLWAGSLASEVKKFLKKENINVSYSPSVIGVTFFILSLLYKLPDPYWLVAFLSFIPILPILEIMNQYYEETEKGLPERSFVWWQIILVGAGLILFILSIYGTLYP